MCTKIVSRIFFGIKNKHFYQLLTKDFSKKIQRNQEKVLNLRVHLGFCWKGIKSGQVDKLVLMINKIATIINSITTLCKSLHQVNVLIKINSFGCFVQNESEEI